MSVIGVNPRQPRDWAQALNHLAKTDRVDVEIRAEMGQVVPHLRPVTPQDTIRQERGDLRVMRARLMEIRTSLKPTGNDLAGLCDFANRPTWITVISRSRLGRDDV